jgi:hypothetical protein
MVEKASLGRRRREATLRGPLRLEALLARLVEYVIGGDEGRKEEEEADEPRVVGEVRPRFEETDRKLLERIAYYERRIAERDRSQANEAESGAA